MRRLFRGLALLLPLLACPTPGWAEEPQIRATNVEVPPALVDTYRDFVAALRSGDRAAIEAYCLPYAIAFSSDERTSNPEYGSDINFPFVASSFHADVLTARQERDDAFLLRTGTSYLRFVLTSSGEWRLYQYGDKPIE